MAQPVSSPDVDTAVRELRAMGCGRSVGRYTVLRRLASGGMAEVYAARSQGISGFEKKVAIKKILPQHAHNERFIRMLEDEARITVGLTHPNIAQVYEFGFDGQDYFLVMEYVEGRPLNRLMQRVDERGLPTIPVDHATQIMIEVAKGLDYAHKQTDASGKSLQIVHRDVSPQNVLITYGGDVKLIDFGIARAEGRSHQTSHGVIKGKLRYLAPEIAVGEEPDARADVYCCGIVLFEMLTGEAMFAPKTDLEAIELASEARVKSPRSRNPKVPKELDDIVMKALTKDRNQRYAAAKDLASDLKLFLNQAYPTYLGDELGALMRRMFESEMGSERRLDALAEQVASEVITADEQGEDATLSARPDSLIGPPSSDRREYRRLVTRHEIQSSNPQVKVGGADGGRSMLVVPARDPSPNAAEDGGPPTTLPPLTAREARGRSNPPITANEATRRAENPLELGGIPTLPLKGEAALRASDIDPQHALVPPPPPLGVRPQVMVALAALLLVVVVSLAFVLSGRQEAAAPGPTGGPIQIPAIDENAPATMRIETRPVVKVTVEVDGQIILVEQPTPVEIDGLSPTETHRFIVRSEGYRDASFDRHLAPAEQGKEILALEAATGTIELVGLRGAAVRVNKGEVQGNKIVAIPLDSLVQVRVEHPFAKPWEKEVFVKDINPIELEVPAPPQPPKGTLVVNARPLSGVYVDGDYKGQTPQTLKLAPGKHKLVLKHPSGEKKTFVQKVTPGKTKTFTHRW